MAIFDVAVVQDVHGFLLVKGTTNVARAESYLEGRDYDLAVAGAWLREGGMWMYAGDTVRRGMITGVGFTGVEKAAQPA